MLFVQIVCHEGVTLTAFDIVAAAKVHLYFSMGTVIDGKSLRLEEYCDATKQNLGYHFCVLLEEVDTNSSFWLPELRFSAVPCHCTVPLEPRFIPAKLPSNLVQALLSREHCEVALPKRQPSTGSLPYRGVSE